MDTGNETKEALAAQIASEQAALAQVKYVPLAQLQPDATQRCHWCGQLSRTLRYTETVNGVDRHKGECCGGHH